MKSILISQIRFAIKKCWEWESTSKQTSVRVSVLRRYLFMLEKDQYNRCHLVAAAYVRWNFNLTQCRRSCWKITRIHLARGGLSLYTIYGPYFMYGCKNKLVTIQRVYFGILKKSRLDYKRIVGYMNCE